MFSRDLQIVNEGVTIKRGSWPTNGGMMNHAGNYPYRDL